MHRLSAQQEGKAKRILLSCHLKFFCPSPNPLPTVKVLLEPGLASPSSTGRSTVGQAS